MLDRARVAAERLVVALAAAEAPGFVHAAAQLERRLESASRRLVAAGEGERTVAAT